MFDKKDLRKSIQDEGKGRPAGQRHRVGHGMETWEAQERGEHIGKRVHVKE